MEDRMYVRGDEVIDPDGEEAIVLGYEGSMVRLGYTGCVDTYDYLPEQIKPNLLRITKPFGLCGKAVQMALKDAWNGEKEDEDSNIEIYGSVEWFKQEPLWKNPCTYRLAKPEPKKKNPEFITISGAKYRLVEGEE